MTQPQGGDQFSLGNAVGYVDMDTSRATAALQSFRGQMQGFFQSSASQWQQMGQQVSSFGQSLSIAMIPVAGAMGTGIRAAGNFEDALAEIQARASVLPDEMEKVRATALQLGADTAFSAQEAADAMLMLLTAGISLDDVLKEDANSVSLLGHVLNGAAAAGADLGTTADQVTNILSSFSLEAAEAGRIVEVMNQASGASPATMTEMGAALSEVGGDARSFGLSLEQTGAILTIFARNGKRGTEAATQLRSILTQMTSKTTDSAKAWDMVNSSLFDANGNSRDFGVVLAEVKAGLENLNAEDQAFVIQQLAGSYGRVGFNALLASEGIDAVVGQMGEQSTAAEVAEARLNTFNGIMESLKGSIETLLITAFTPFIDSLKPGLKLQIKWINGLTSWVTANQRLVQPLLHLLKIMTFVGPALIIIGKALPLVVAGFGALFSPIGLMIVAIAALSAAWSANLGNIQFWTQATFTVIHDIFVFRILPIFNPIRDALQNAAESFKLFSESGKSNLEAFGHAILSFANTLGIPVSALLGFRRTFFNVLGGIQSRLEPVRRVFHSLGLGWRILNTNLSSGNSVLRSVIQAWTIFATSLGASWETVLGINKGIFSFFGTIENAAKQTFDAIAGIVTKGISIIRAAISLASGDMAGTGGALSQLMLGGFDADSASKIVGQISGVFDGIRTTIARFVGFIQVARALLSGNIAGAGQAFSILAGLGFSGTEAAKVIGHFNNVIKPIRNVFTTITDAFQNARFAFAFFTGFGLTRLQAFGAALQVFAADIGIPVDAILRFRDTIVNTFTRIANALRPLFQEIQTFFGNLFGGADSSQLTSLIQPVWEVGHVLLQLTNPIGQISLLLRALGIDIFPMFMNAFEGGAAILTSFFQSMNSGTAPIDALKASLGNPQWLDAIIAGFTGLANFVTGTVIPALNQLRDWFLYTVLPGVVGFVTGTVIPAIQGFFNFLSLAWATIQPGLQAMWDWFTTSALPAIVTFITGTVIPAIQSFIGILVSIWNTLAPALEATRVAILDIANNVLTALVNVWTNNLQPALMGLWGVIQEHLLPVLAQLGQFVGEVVVAAFQWLAQFWTNSLLPIIQAIGDFIANMIIPILGFLAEMLINVVGLAIQGIAFYWESMLLPALRLVWDFIVMFVLPIFQAVVDFFGLVLTVALEALAWTWENVLKPAIDIVIQVLQNLWTSVQSGIESFRDNMSVIFTWINDNVIQPVINVLSGIWDAIQGGIQALKDGIAAAFNWIKTNVIDPIIGRIQDFINLMTGLREGAMNELNEFNQSFQEGGVGGVIQQGAGNIGQTFSTIFGSLGWMDSGGRGQAGQPVMIGRKAQPELFLPDSAGTYIPNFDQMMGDTYNFENITISANSYAEGRAAADGFETRIMELSRARG